MRFVLFNSIEFLIKKIRNKRPFDNWFLEDYKKFLIMSDNNHDFPITNNYPCLNDKFEESGTANGAYFYQDFFVAKQIYENSPQKHVDIGSRIDGFVAHIAVFRKIEVFDIRNLTSSIENIIFKQADLMNPESYFQDYCDSISCLHALEHFGLGRYGDKLDPYGHVKGFKSVTQILRKGGIFYFSVPMGVQRIEFNAHRIFSLTYLLKWVSTDFMIQTFSYIDDFGDFHENVELTNVRVNSSFDCNHGCAVFVLRKK